MKTPNRTREASDLGPMLRRLMRALVRRAESGEVDALLVLLDVQQRVGAEIAQAILALHDDAGLSYEFIAREMGVTKQAVIQRATRRGLDT